MTPAVKPSEPHHSGCTSHVPKYYQQLACEDDAEHLNYVFTADFDDVIADSISDLNDNPVSLQEAQSQPDSAQWREAMNHKIEMLHGAGCNT